MLGCGWGAKISRVRSFESGILRVFRTPRTDGRTGGFGARRHREAIKASNAALEDVGGVTWRVPAYLGGFKQQIPVPSCDPEGVAIRHAVGADLAVGERLQRLGLSLAVQRHRCSSDAQPQLLGKASS